MTLFRRRDTATVEAAGSVALATTHRPTAWGVGIQRLAPADFPFPPTDVWSREAAMSVPTISRARDLICSAVGSLPLCLYTVKFDQASREPVEQREPPAGWMNRPDPNRTRQWVLSWTTDDLLFLGRAYWRITDRYKSSYPSSFQWMPAADVAIDAVGTVRYLGKVVDPSDVVEFLSPTDGILFTGWRTISTATNLDQAAERFSTAEIPAGWLQQTKDSEPMSADDLTDIAESFGAARMARAVAALNPYIEWHESSMDPSRLQLVEARRHQAVELARIANVPAYYVDAPPQGSGITYTNSVQARADLIDFAALPYIAAIEQTLGGPNVTPNGQAVRLDVNAWLRNPYTPNDNASPTDLEIAYNTPAVPAPPASPRGPGRPRDFDGSTA